MLQSLLLHYGYAIVFFGCFLEGETVLVVAGIAAKLGYLDLTWVMVSATAGSFLGDQLYFLIGRRYGDRLLARFPSWKPRADRVSRLLRRYDTWFILSFRFIYGLRTVSPFVLGSAKLPHGKFAILNFIAALVWAVAVSAAGFAFGHAIEGLLADIVRYERFILEGVFAAGFLVWLVYVLRQRRRRTSSATDGA